MRRRFHRWRPGAPPFAAAPCATSPSPPSEGGEGRGGCLFSTISPLPAPSSQGEGGELPSADGFKSVRSKSFTFTSLIPATPALSRGQGQRMLLPSPEGRFENSPPFQE